MKAVHNRASAIRLMRKAIGAGAKITSASAMEWNVARGCTSPVRVSLTHRTQLDPLRSRQKGATDLWTADLDTRCRKCEGCLRARAALWRGRAMAEIAGSTRTWFGTLTLNAHEQFRALAAATLTARRDGVEWAGLTVAEKFKRRCVEIGKEVTLFMKRVRKQSGAKIRYVLVFEAHKSGDPHLHMLVHEGISEVRHRLLQAQWTLGFSNWKLVKDRVAASYVTKYLSKAAIARVRASLRYGTDYLFAQKTDKPLGFRGETPPVEENLTSPNPHSNKDATNGLADCVQEKATGAVSPMGRWAFKTAPTPGSTSERQQSVRTTGFARWRGSARPSERQWRSNPAAFAPSCWDYWRFNLESAIQEAAVARYNPAASDHLGHGPAGHRQGLQPVQETTVGPAASRPIPLSTAVVQFSGGYEPELVPGPDHGAGYGSSVPATHVVSMEGDVWRMDAIG